MFNTRECRKVLPFFLTSAQFVCILGNLCIFAKKFEMKRLVLILLLLGMNALLFGQIQVRYDKEPVIDSISNAYENAWKSVKYTEGYRIQLVAVSTKNGAQRVYNEFKSSYPDVSAYLSYTEPTFRVRVGNFKNRIDAYRFLMKIQGQFPGAFITKDKISFREI